MIPVGDWIPDGKPSWWDTAQTVLSDPEGWLRETLGKWLAGGMITVLSYVLWAVYQPFVIAADTFGILADALGDGVGPAATAILDAVTGLNESLAAAAASAGIAAPVVVWFVTVLEIMVVLWLLNQAAKWAKPVILSFNPL